MSRATLKAVLCCAPLLLAAARPASCLTLGVLPAQPLEGTRFTLAIGYLGDCAGVNGVVVTPGLPGVVTVSLLLEGCPGVNRPPRPMVLEVPIGPLTSGPWDVRVQFIGGQETLRVNIQPTPFGLDFDPPHPVAGDVVNARLTGHASCPILDPAQKDGNLLTLQFFGGCPILPPSSGPFELEQTLEPLQAGDYVVQVVGEAETTIASRRLHVFGPTECIPSETVVCLQRGRFRVEATWRTGTGQGAAKAHPETADSGAFWFFGPDNLELLVKVLDACRHPSGTFWVYAAGLTDVEVELVVTDTLTQQVRRYRNPLGKAFAPVLDSGAFSC